MVLIWLIMVFMLTENVTVVKANNCWQTSVSIHYTVGPSVVTVTQSDANSVMNEVLSHGKSQLSCQGLTLKLLNVSIITPGNLYSIKGFFGVIYGNMDSNQKSIAKTCLSNAVIFNDIVLRPDYYTSPLKGTHWADRASLTNYQDATCCFNGMFPSNGVCVSPAVSSTPTVILSPSSSISPSTSSNGILPDVSAAMLSSPPLPLPSPSTSPSPPSPSPSASPVPAVTVYSTVNITSCFTATPSKTLATTTTPINPVRTTVVWVTLYVNSCAESPTTTIATVPVSSTIQTTTLPPPPPTTTQTTTRPTTERTTELTTLPPITTEEPTTSAIPPPPRNIKATDIGTMYIVLKWEQPDNVQYYQITKYIINYKKSEESVFRRLKTYSNTLSKRIENLEENTNYDFQLYSENAFGQSASPSTFSATTLKLFLDFVNFVSSKNVSLGDTVHLYCAVLGTATDITMTWSKEDEAIYVVYSPPGLNYTKALNLTLKGVTTNQAGNYFCDVSSSTGIHKKRKLQLGVQVSEQVKMEMKLNYKEFHQDLSNSSSPRYNELVQEFKQQGADVFRKVDGFQRIEVLGFKSGSVVVDFTIFISQVLSAPQNSPPDLVQEVNTIMIEQAKTGSFGNYSISPDSLFLKAIPPPPRNIKAPDIGTMYIELEWEKPLNWESYQITKYILKYKKSEEPDFKEIELDANTLRKKTEELEKNTKYDFQLYSKNVVGKSTPYTFSANTLSVNPVIANDKQEFIFKKGETAVLLCIGSSEQRPDDIQWTSKLPSLAETYRNETKKSINLYMTLTDVQEENAGIYKCRTSKKDAVGVGSVTLIVIVPVEVKLNATLNETFTEDLKNETTPKYKRLKTKFENELSKLYVNLTGFVRVEVIGFTNGSVKVRFRVIVEVKVGEAKQLDKPSRTKVDVTKRIIKKVKTSGGEIGGGLFIKKNSITSDAPPPSPRNVTVKGVGETTAHLRWMEPEDADAFSIETYTIKVKKFEHEWQEKVTTQHFQLDSQIEKLKDDTHYIAKVFARGNGGVGLDSEQQEFKTKDVTIDLTWLWVCLALFLVLGIVVFLVYHHKKKQIVDHRYDANGNRAGQRRASIPSNLDPKHVKIFSYRNNAFALSSMDFESLGLMPGKWWEIPRGTLTLGDTLGSGQFGMVKKGFLEIENGEVTCAVKMLKNSAGEEEARDLLNELEIMTGAGTHANLVNLIGACTIGGPLLIALEFAEGGSLLSYIKTNVMPVDDGSKASSLSHQEKLEIGLDIARGMQHLANVKCVHRDLAARNVLLTGDRRAKIADFGLSRDVYERGFYEKQSQGKLPVRWMSPEAIQQMMFTTKGDVWSYGVVLWEIESGGKLPYGGIGMLELIDYLKKGQRLARPGRCLQSLYNVMLDCWHMDPDRRPTFDNICANMEELLSQSEFPQIDFDPQRYELHPHFGAQ